MSFWRRVFCCMTEESLDVNEATRLLPNENSARENQDNEVPFVLHAFGVLPEGLNLCELPRNICRDGIKKISCGREHFLLLTENGHVLTGGNNTFGQCGEAPSQEPLHLSGRYQEIAGNSQAVHRRRSRVIPLCSTRGSSWSSADFRGKQVLHTRK
mmetsp:Transcript_9445/g.18174  ORF Transcript_9445/g.18174 Transcript_9445/m.18174 type:complete len:156 (+) Transcript_9445:20-487(+)